MAWQYDGYLFKDAQSLPLNGMMMFLSFQQTDSTKADLPVYSGYVGSKKGMKMVDGIQCHLPA